MLEQELGSLMKHVHAAFPVDIWTTNATKDLLPPTLYFPPPIMTSRVIMPDAFQYSYTLNVKLFHKSQEEAFAHAHAISISLCKYRMTFKLMDEAGEDTGKVKKLKAVRVSMLTQPDEENHIAEIAIEWDSIYRYEQEAYEKMMEVNIKRLSKEE
jgi:hypothetical protein